jgi:hypothetical protein
VTRDVVVAMDPARQSLAPLALGGRLARARRVRVLRVTVFPHHPLVEGPEDERQRAARTDAFEALMGLGRTLEDVELDHGRAPKESGGLAAIAPLLPGSVAEQASGPRRARAWPWRAA